MTTYHAPGVYVEEVATLPPSVAEVSTAIPAFIGYTEKGAGALRIDTLIDYEQRFGGPPARAFSVNTATDTAAGVTSITSVVPASVTFEHRMYHAVSLYFKNGGGSCYIVSIGGYGATPAKADFEAGLALVEREDEPTLIVLPDAAGLAAADYLDLCQQALAQCEKLGDRFAILDVPGDDIDGFRTGIGTKGLMYGAAYYPSLATTLVHHTTEETVTVNGPDVTLASLRTTETGLYNQIKTRLAAQRIEMPPSGAVAGVYAYVDRTRGVWKAPANVSLSSVIGPTVKITNEAQEGLNVDPTAGKSINAIRAFAGKGTLVWGARTLAGNDNEWRYVPVRRLFNLIEESTRKASSFAVFEPNDQTTWLKVKGMIDSYLYGLWEKGALAGPTPESAYYVNVGLGTTMTTQDILEGRMNVEIGVAAVRPAEFIILRFSHKLQEA